MQITPLFSTPLVRASLGAQSPLIARLRETILAHEAATPQGVQHSNDGGWQSTDNFLDWAGDAGAALIEGLTQMVNQVTLVVDNGQLRKVAPAWTHTAWANVNRKGNGNHAHFHPGAYWSAVTYVDDGGIAGKADLGGCIEFTDPRGPLPMMYAPTVKVNAQGYLSAGLAERIYPETGAIIIFPSWLLHSVAPYSGDGIRISVAVNFSV